VGGRPLNPGEPPVFEAADLVKEYDDGRVPALRGISFTIRPSEFVSLLGPSGCGKTTLLNMLGLLDAPTGGSLRFRGTEMAEIRDPSDYRAREIGFIFQAFHLLPTFTVEENVQIPMFGQGVPRAARKARAGELLEAVGLAHRRNHLPVKLSGGERQRAAIARSLVNRPRVLLADEPTGNLDSRNSNQVLELLVRLQSDLHTTLILVTHDPDIARLAPRAIRIKDGLILSDGPYGEAAP